MRMDFHVPHSWANMTIQGQGRWPNEQANGSDIQNSKETSPQTSNNRNGRDLYYEGILLAASLAVSQSPLWFFAYLACSLDEVGAIRAPCCSSYPVCKWFWAAKAGNGTAEAITDAPRA